MNTAECAYCGKRVSVLDRARPSLCPHICVKGYYSRGAIKAGSTQYREPVTR